VNGFPYCAFVKEGVKVCFFRKQAGSELVGTERPKKRALQNLLKRKK
jgi:hypothetical protein